MAPNSFGNGALKEVGGVKRTDTKKIEYEEEEEEAKDILICSDNVFFIYILLR
jgi:hypothetical protein